MSTLDHNFNDIAGAASKPKGEAQKYPPPFSIRLTFEERAQLDAQRGRMPLSAYIRERLLARRKPCRRN